MKNSLFVQALFIAGALYLPGCKTDPVSVQDTGCTVDIPIALTQSSNIDVDGKMHVINKNSISLAYFGPDNELPTNVRKFKTLLTISCFDTVGQSTTSNDNSIFIRVFDPPTTTGKYYFRQDRTSGFAYGQFSAKNLCDGSCQTQMDDSCSYVEITSFDTVAHKISGKFRTRRNVTLLDNSIKQKIFQGSFTDIFLDNEPSSIGKVTAIVTGTPWSSIFSSHWNNGFVRFQKADHWFELHAFCQWPSGKDKEWLQLYCSTPALSGTLSLWPLGGSFTKTLDTGAPLFQRTEFQSRTPDDGHVTITSYDPIYNRVSGTFTAKVYDSTGAMIEIKDGVFNDLEIREQ